MNLSTRGRCFWMAVPAAILLVPSVAVQADDAFFEVEVNDLTITDGQMPEQWQQPDWRNRRRIEMRAPYATLDVDGEVYLGRTAGWTQRLADVSNRFRSVRAQLAETEADGEATERDVPRTANASAIAVRAPKGTDITGSLFVPRADLSGMQRLRFRIPSSKADSAARRNFYLTKRDHYRRLAARNIPGGAWFRHQVREAEAALKGEDPQRPIADRDELTQNARRAQANLERTFAFMSGGRAVSENLQLDRLLPTTDGSGKATVALDSLEGITVAEMDWKALIEGTDPQLDPLAKRIPHDQHAVFFPSFQALVTTIDEAVEIGTPVLFLQQQQAADDNSLGQYQRQLCLELDAVARAIGPQVIRTVACTGSDPYLRTGTDLALLFNSDSPRVLRQFISLRQQVAGKQYADSQAVSGTVGGIEYQGVVTPHRELSSYMGTLDANVVAVTNSLAQLERLAKAAQGGIPPLGSLPEYHYFRNRYPRTDSETAFVILSDATIRRWCGPKWRIATSRRTRAAAILAEHQARHLDAVVRQTAEPQMLHTEFFVHDLGTLRLTPSGVTSSTYGTLNFLTPISELNFKNVTEREARLYRRWREGYQRNWSRFFDPIAVRFVIRDETLSADLTVMPLIDNSDYDRMARVTGNAEIAPDAGDRHADTLAHWAMAIDLDSREMRQAANFLQNMMPGEAAHPLSWMGDSIAVYADDDPYWRDLAQAMAEASPSDVDPARDDFFEANLYRLPFALHVEVKSGFKLTLFLTGLRGFIEQTAPGMLQWETLKYNERPYVKITPTEELPLGIPDLAIYYAATNQSLTVTLNQDVLKRALDRQAASANRQAAAVPETRETDVLADTTASAPKGGGEEPQEGDKQQVADEPDKTADGSSTADSKSGESDKAEDSVNTKAERDDLLPWLGESQGFLVYDKGLRALDRLFSDDYQRTMQIRCWSNLPILNEWKRRYPDRDPVGLHSNHWQIIPRCPGGGEYIWNEEFQTMESTVHGHPGTFQSDPLRAPVPWESLNALNFGLTLERDNQALRARVRLHREMAE